MRYAIFIMLALATLFVVGCTTIEPTNPPTEQPPSSDPIVFAQPDTTVLELESFSSKEEFEAAFGNLGGNSYYGGFGDGRMLAMEESMDSAVAAAPQALESAKGSSNDFSETNVQVQGIDEADLIKTDGDYIYTISGNNVYIVRGYPGEDAEKLEQLEYEDGSPQALFINDNHLVVIGTEYSWDRRNYWGSSSSTFIDVFDVSDHEDADLIETYKVEGAYFQARMKDGFAYVATRTYSYYGIPEVPVMMRGDVVSEMPVSNIFRYPIPYRRPQLTSMHSFDIDSPQDLESVAILTEGEPTLYMSHDNIYIASQQYVDEQAIQNEVAIALIEPQLSDTEKSKVMKIRMTDSDVLSDAEKQQKIMEIIERHIIKYSEEDLDLLEKEMEDAYKLRLKDYPYFEYTMLSRIEYDDGDLDVKADGKVPGSLNNQFSMDEYDNVLRLATTVNARWSWVESERTESVNQIYTLDEDLDELDSITDIAKGERIFSARFMGERLYLVTFRQVDPFFAVDLSNPRDIEILGELKIPGFSRYLHPYDDNIIIGLGQDATDEGRTTGLKISLFDVSDVTTPEEIESYKVSGKYSSSSAEYDHHAMLFSKEKNLLVIPLNQYDYETRNNFNGVLVFEVSEDDIDLRGEIMHGDGDYDYRGRIDRSLFIEDELITRSYYELEWHDLDTLDFIESVDLEKKVIYRPVYYDDIEVVR